MTRPHAISVGEEKKMTDAKEQCVFCRKDYPPKVRGWTRRQDGLMVCAACWGERFVARAIALPVNRAVDIEWCAVDAALRVAWNESTDLARWAVETLLRHDFIATASMGELPKWKPIDLYKIGFSGRGYPAREAWTGACGSAADVLDAVKREYLESRKEVLWDRTRRQELYRYPYPYPVRDQELSCQFGEDGKPQVKLNLPGIGKCCLGLRGGPEFARQMKHFRGIVAGEIESGAASIYRQRSSTGRHRRTISDREPGGEDRAEYTVMLKIVVWLPRAEKPTHGRTMLLMRDPEAFLVGEIDGVRQWVLNADQVRRWQAEHEAFLQRFAQDMKFERRSGLAPASGHIRTLRCVKFERRMNTWCQQAAAYVCGWAARHKVAYLIYDEMDRGYLPSFRWDRFATSLANRAEADGLSLVLRKGHSLEPLAEGA